MLPHLLELELHCLLRAGLDVCLLQHSSHVDDRLLREALPRSTPTGPRVGQKGIVERKRGEGGGEEVLDGECRERPWERTAVEARWADQG